MVPFGERLLNGVPGARLLEAVIEEHTSIFPGALSVYTTSCTSTLNDFTEHEATEQI